MHRDGHEGCCPEDLLALAVLADGTIKDAKDLKGKKIGVLSMGASRTLNGYAMVQAAASIRRPMSNGCRSASACRPQSLFSAATYRRWRFGT